MLLLLLLLCSRYDSGTNYCSVVVVLLLCSRCDAGTMYSCVVVVLLVILGVVHQTKANVYWLHREVQLLLCRL